MRADTACPTSFLGQHIPHKQRSFWTAIAAAAAAEVLLLPWQPSRADHSTNSFNPSQTELPDMEFNCCLVGFHCQRHSSTVVHSTALC